MKGRVLTERTAVVRSTVSEARAQAVTVEWTVQDGEVRKPVTGGACTGDTDVHGGADDERSEAEGVSEGDVAEGCEPWRGVRKPAVGRFVSSPARPLYVTGPVLAAREVGFTIWSCMLRRLLEMEGRKSMESSEELIKQMFGKRYERPTFLCRRG